MVPCGKCIACVSRRRNEWTYRLTKEHETSSYTFFGTLTYNDDKIPKVVNEGILYYGFNKSDVQKYIKRVRYFIGEISSDIKCKYFVVSEYGCHTHRPHYHYLFFVKNDEYHKHRKQIEMILRGTWSNGFSVVVPPSPARIHYVTKYCLKGFDKKPDDCFDPVFTLSSKSSYIGSDYYDQLEKQTDLSKPDPVVFFNGQQMAMPRIYRNNLGLSGHSSEMYNDLMTYNQADVMYRRFCRRFPDPETRPNFDQWSCEMFKKYEKIAIARQNKRNEQL